MVAALAVGLAAVGIVPSTPSGADPSDSVALQWEIRVSSVRCDPSLGRWQTSFGFKNGNTGLSLAFTSVILADIGAEIVGTFAPNPFVSGQWTDGLGSTPGNVNATAGGTTRYTADGAPHEFDFPGFLWSSTGPCLQVADLVVGPAVTQPGATVTISGTGCVQPPATNVGTNGADGAPSASNSNPLSGTVSGTVGFAPPVPFGPVTAAPDGTWTTTVVVPTGTPPGSYSVSATCTYPPVAITGVAAQAVTPTSFAYQTRTITLPVVTRTITLPVVASPKFTG